MYTETYYPLADVLLLVVCGIIAGWGKAHLDFLQCLLPYRHGAPGGRWLTIPMNRIDPALLQGAFTCWERSTWLRRPEFVAIDGKTAGRSHDRATGEPPLHLVSAIATKSWLLLGQEAVADQSNELTAIPVLLAPLAEGDRLRSALVSVDPIATSGTIATATRQTGADHLLAVKANQPRLRASLKARFDDAPAGSVDQSTKHDKGHCRIERREIAVICEVDWLSGDRRSPGELRLPPAASMIVSPRVV